MHYMDMLRFFFCLFTFPCDILKSECDLMHFQFFVCRQDTHRHIYDLVTCISRLKFNFLFTAFLLALQIETDNFVI